MDPNEALRLLRLTLKQFRVDEDPGVRKAHAEEIAEYVQALDEWLSKGGFLPAPWNVAHPMPVGSGGPDPLGPPNPAHGELPEHVLRELEPDVEDSSVCCPDCGDTLGVMVREVDHRRGAYWTGDGEIVVGKSNDVQTEEIELFCHQGHGHFVVPDVADYS